MISNVLICDDNSDRATRWKDTVEQYLPEARVDTITGTELAALLTELSDAEDEARSGNPLSGADRPRTRRAEEADLVILDSDLSPAPDDLARLGAQDRRTVSSTLRNGYGDDVARQLRSYSHAPAIVVVNMFWGRHARSKVFDLTLNQNAGAVADLHITAGELSDPVVWGQQPDDADSGYRPWYRPSIPEVVDTFQRSAAAQMELDENVLDTLGIAPSRLTPSQLDPFTESAESLTLRNFAESALGFKYTHTKDGAHHSDQFVRAMGLSAVRRWVQRFLVPSQTVLLDAPHLAERYWRVLMSGPDDLQALDRFANLTWGDDFGALGPAVQESIRPFATRPVFDEAIARRIAAEQIRSKLLGPGSLEAAFAEDTSRFVALDELTQFPSDLPGDFKQRWLEEVEGIGYEPANRLLL
ncbi:hypothetical protein [Microbacterium sp. PRC9]|uniref:hypothetical protein n=1 Tax=Microbacterium sp. PRC9 TaxID=2962591 RepID=UPI0028810D41|nr:hypothetical protein [Microbacterium sp. PRC9]MDT0141970.1 hypothetical protein [Microbacterium sp. PRC9]